MNKEILNKLRDEAGFGYGAAIGSIGVQEWWIEDDGDGETWPSRTLMEKFAELIVAECLEVTLSQKKWVEDQDVFDHRDVTWNKARIQQSQHIADKIKQHFGVEE